MAQNIFLGHEKKKRWLLDDAAMRAEAVRVLKQVGLALHPDTKVKQLIVAEKQLVEIAKALARKARLLIMDEPTATLTPGETARLFSLMQQLKSEGVTILYISHKLDEVEHITDEVLVLRDGRLVAREDTKNVTRHQMANLMVGRELADLYPERTAAPRGGEPLFRVTKLNVPGWAKDVSFEVRRGEILGFAGLVGAGRTELFEGLLGLRPHTVEKIELDGKVVRFKSPRHAVKQGFAYLSEDRKGKGLHVSFGLRENLTLMALERYTRPFLQPKRELEALRGAVGAFGLRTGSLSIRASSLSGGNQQKLALAKVLHPEPKVLVLDEPTRGVDVGAKRDIYFLIQQSRRRGPGGHRGLVRADGAHRPLPPGRGDAPRRRAGRARRRTAHRRGARSPMPPAPAEEPTPQARTGDASKSAAGRSWARLQGLGPVAGLVLLCIGGYLLNCDFAGARQRDERAHPHGLHRHHLGGHVASSSSPAASTSRSARWPR